MTVRASDEERALPAHQQGGQPVKDVCADDCVISTQGLSKTFGAVNALQGLDLQVAPHSIFGFLGPNGSGKSTTIKLLLGLIRPTGGHATVFGMDSVRDSIAIRERVGYLAQDPRYYEQLTAREIMRLTAHFFYRGTTRAIESRLAETLDLVGLSGKSDRPIKGFSGGERQRLGIAQAQVNYPDLLILDEPAASLDPQGRHDVLEVMERLRKHTTIFYSTHILEDVQRVSDTVAILSQGRLIAQAPIGELLSGKGDLTYHVAMKGDGGAAQARVAALPWVSSVVLKPGDAQSMVFQIHVTDESAAEFELLRVIMSDPTLVVTEFGRKKLNLEEVFLQIVGNQVKGVVNNRGESNGNSK